MEGWEGSPGGAEQLQRLDELAQKIKEALKDDYVLEDEKTNKIAWEKLEKMTASTPLSGFAVWLETDSTKWLDNPRFFYIIAEIYQKRRKN